jgi:hypothetical protein
MEGHGVDSIDLPDNLVPYAGLLGHLQSVHDSPYTNDWLALQENKWYDIAKKYGLKMPPK